MIHCPLCNAEIDVEEEELDEGDSLICEECGANLDVSGVSPLELTPDADDEDDEDDEDEEDEDDLDDFDDELVDLDDEYDDMDEDDRPLRPGRYDE